MITCPKCGEHLLVFLDIPGERQQSQQPETSDLTHRFQACYYCKTHTNQTLVPVGNGKGQWQCNICKNKAKKTHDFPLTVDF